MTERMLRDTAAGAKSAQGIVAQHAPNFRYIALRYFSVADARLDDSIGQATALRAPDQNCFRSGLRTWFGGPDVWNGLP